MRYENSISPLPHGIKLGPSTLRTKGNLGTFQRFEYGSHGGIRNRTEAVPIAPQALKTVGPRAACPKMCLNGY